MRRSMKRAIKRTKEDERAFANLCATLVEIQDAKVMASFMEGMLTPAEMTEVSRRWRLLHLLHDGMPQRQIAALLRTSFCKITRGSRELKRPDSAVRMLIDSNKTKGVSHE